MLRGCVRDADDRALIGQQTRDRLSHIEELPALVVGAETTIWRSQRSTPNEPLADSAHADPEMRSLEQVGNALRRVGPIHYNTANEIDRFCGQLAALSR